MAPRRRLPWGWISSSVILVLILSISSIRGFFSRTVLTLSTPVIVSGQWIGNQFHTNPNLKTVTNQRNQLQQQVKDLTARLYDTSQALETFHSLDALATFGQTTKHQLVYAAVIASSPDPGIQSVVINRGSDQRIVNGQMVVSDKGYVIGKIVAVHQSTSTVLLLTDRQSVIAARVQNTPQSPGAVRGERGLALNMGFIPKNDPLLKGQNVVTSGTEQHIPPDILIGTMTSITSRNGDLFQQAVLTPAATLQRIRTVAVIIQ